MLASSQCILASIIVSTVVTVLVCILSAVVLYEAPEEPWYYVANGGDYTRWPALVLFLAALLALLISFIGCCGLSRDSKAVLILFSVLALLVAGMEIASSGVVFAFTYTNKIEDEMADRLGAELMDYSNNSSHQLDELQKDYDCCGVHNYSDWRDMNTTWSQEEKSLSLAPQSCCRDQYAHFSNCTEHAQTLHSQGCVDVLMERLKPVIDAIFGMTILAAVAEVVAASASCYGANLIWRYQQYDII